MQKTKKQFNLMALLPAIAAFIMIGIFAGVGAKVLDDLGKEVTTGSQANASIENATQGIGNLTSYLGLLGTIVILGVIIAVLMGVLGYFKFGR